jgi:hypothetical protein
MSQKRRIRRSVKLEENKHKIKLKLFVTLALQTGNEQYYKYKWEKYVDQHNVRGVVTDTLTESKGKYLVLLEKIKKSNLPIS